MVVFYSVWVSAMRIASRIASRVSSIVCHVCTMHDTHTPFINVERHNKPLPLTYIMCMSRGVVYYVLPHWKKGVCVMHCAHTAYNQGCGWLFPSTLKIHTHTIQHRQWFIISILTFKIWEIVFFNINVWRATRAVVYNSLHSKKVGGNIALCNVLHLSPDQLFPFS